MCLFRGESADPELRSGLIAPWDRGWPVCSETSPARHLGRPPRGPVQGRPFVHRMVRPRATSLHPYCTWRTAHRRRKGPPEVEGERHEESGEGPEDEEEAAKRFRDIGSHPALAEEVLRQTGVQISKCEIGRLLRFHGLQPQMVTRWLSSSVKDVQAKAARGCGVYRATPANEVVVCVDEKPIQVLTRLYPDLVDEDAAILREFECVRHGRCVLLAGFNIRTGKGIAELVPRRAAEAFVRFMQRVADAHPGKAIHLEWDHLDPHVDGKDARWTRFNQRNGDHFRFTHTPIHASWLNPVEIQPKACRSSQPIPPTSSTRPARSTSTRASPTSAPTNTALPSGPRPGRLTIRSVTHASAATPPPCGSSTSRTIEAAGSRPDSGRRDLIGSTGWSRSLAGCSPTWTVRTRNGLPKDSASMGKPCAASSRRYPDAHRVRA